MYTSFLFSMPLWVHMYRDKNRRSLSESELGYTEIYKSWIANKICRTLIMFYI